MDKKQKSVLRILVALLLGMLSSLQAGFCEQLADTDESAVPPNSYLTVSECKRELVRPRWKVYEATNEEPKAFKTDLRQTGPVGDFERNFRKCQ
jgi:hypothetical protein